MKKIFLSLLLISLTTGSFSNPFVVADTLRINGHLALWLGSGMDWEDGFNYGWLLGHQIKPVFENYVIPSAFGGVAGYNQARQIFDQHFVVDDKYIEIAQGMISGMEMANVDLYSTVLNDTLTYKDILIANSIPDFTAFAEKWHYIGPGCSNLTSWGDATMNAPELAGETVINRNLDWDNNPHLINNALIIIWVTGDPSKQSFVTFGFTGLIGALSGMNESGVATFQNMGNYYAYPTGTDFYPINLAQRNGLEAADYNGDGICSPRDVSDAVRAHNVASTFIIHSAGPSYLEPAAEVLEIHNAHGYAIRTKTDNPEFFGDNLVATNHFRLLKPPSYCYRYSRISDSLELSNHLDVNRNWKVLTTAGVTTNLQTIQFIPMQNIIRFSFAEIGVPAYLIQPTEVWMDTLFTMINVGINELPAINEAVVSVYPNPAKNIINIELNTKSSVFVSVTILDLNGRQILNNHNLPALNNDKPFVWDTTGNPDGVYFARVHLKDKHTGKLTIETKKIVVAR
jgi:hypothetical protein